MLLLELRDTEREFRHAKLARQRINQRSRDHRLSVCLVHLIESMPKADTARRNPYTAVATSWPACSGWPCEHTPVQVVSSQHVGSDMARHQVQKRQDSVHPLEIPADGGTMPGMCAEQVTHLS